MGNYAANHAVRVDGMYSESASPAGTNSVPLGLEFRVPYSTGSGSYQSNKYYAVHIVGNTTIELDAGVIQDPLGNAITFVAVKGLWIINRSITNQVLLSGDFLTNVLESAGGGFLIVGVGGQLLMEHPIGGYIVTGTADDTLSIVVTDTTLGADVFIWGN